MKRFKHSGTHGDIIYSLAVVKHLGGGEFYLHLNQIDWIVQHYYGGQPLPFHRGRMTEEDYLQLREFMLAQPYITCFEPFTADKEITHNLDRFRPLFVNHPGNYVDMFSGLFNIEPKTQKILRDTPWLTVKRARRIENRSVIINRTPRWQSPGARASWDQIKQQGAEDHSVFIGLEEEYHSFCSEMAWRIPYEHTENINHMAEIIAGADQFIGNQSLALSLAIGLGIEYACEARADLPLVRNECYFPDHPRGDYFQ